MIPPPKGRWIERNGWKYWEPAPPEPRRLDDAEYEAAMDRAFGITPGADRPRDRLGGSPPSEPEDR